MSRVIRSLPAAAILLTTSLSGVQAACATGHVAATLSDFAPEARSSPFYWGVEGSGSGQVTFVLRAIGDDCTPSAVTISYATKDGAGPHNPATAPSDYAPTSGRRAVATDPTHGGNDRQPVSVPLVGDVVPEAVLESATVELTGVQGGGHLSAPTSAALHIVDDDGPNARISLDPNAIYRQAETYSMAGVAVFRGGSATGTVTVPYTVEPGPAPAAEPGADYRAASGTMTFAPGDRVEMVPITLLNDRDTEGEEKITVTLTGAEGGAIDGASSATFTILDNEELGAPESLFHHPRHKRTYRAKDYKIREIHVFTTDRGGSGVTAAEVALRKNLRRGGCEWWVGKRWKRASCRKLTWLRTGQYETDFFYLRFPSLPKSRGAIESYTAFSRAIDGAGNKERQLDPGRNANTFEIQEGGLRWLLGDAKICSEVPDCPGAAYLPSVWPNQCACRRPPRSSRCCRGRKQAASWKGLELFLERTHGGGGVRTRSRGWGHSISEGRAAVFGTRQGSHPIREIAAARLSGCLVVAKG